MSEVFYVRFMHNCVAYTDLDKIMSDKMCAFSIFSFYFSFSAENEFYFYFSFIFRLFFGRKTKFHIRFFFIFRPKKKKIIFGQPLPSLHHRMIVAYLRTVQIHTTYNVCYWECLFVCLIRTCNSRM